MRYRGNDHDPFGMLLVDRTWQSTTTYKYGFNGKENVDDVYGNDVAVDFGARVYDGRLGRWLSVDKLTQRNSFEAPYVFVSNSPMLFIDPTGNEKIIVSGGKDLRADLGGDKMKFINAGIAAIQAYRDEMPQEGRGSQEQITWLVTLADYTEAEWKTIQEVATANKVNLIAISSTEELTNYVNGKTLDQGNGTDQRANDPISDMSIFAHGWSNNIGLAHGNRNATNEETGEIYSIDDHTRITSGTFETWSPKSFSSEAELNLTTCNSATPILDSSSSLASNASNELNITVNGFEGSACYYGITSSDTVVKKDGVVIKGEVSLPNGKCADGQSTIVTFNPE
ncbi:MAG: hypothetical protein IPI65_22140 [Bacteroidetes bacterium]|nr:hypothetical protein [Bacteroidota bacterium]